MACYYLDRGWSCRQRMSYARRFQWERSCVVDFRRGRKTSRRFREFRCDLGGISKRNLRREQTTETKLIIFRREEKKLRIFRKKLRETEREELNAMRRLVPRIRFRDFNWTVYPSVRVDRRFDEIIQFSNSLKRSMHYNGFKADFATSAVDFLHRVGRTARAGQYGLVTSLYTESNQDLVDAIRQAGKLGQPVETAFSRKRSFRNKLKKRGSSKVRGTSTVEMVTV
ncbi:probable ATP-dependent RNA helicase DDX52 [Pistacia vera]|uniref:probable ATP-dependent RNA helicase DDX52 n=1 Tax=Pistacia vera TaxID=55513 RepID=UPI001262CE2C|nr:probable ATP-dependent RNA helicase DDX52 [Pistacia vera]